VNTHGSSILTTVLVVVNKKQTEKFREVYPTCLINFYEQDFEAWQKRTRANVEHSNQNIEDEGQRNEIIDAEYRAQLQQH